MKYTLEINAMGESDLLNPIVLGAIGAKAEVQPVNLTAWWVFYLHRGDQEGESGKIAIVGGFHECLRELNRTLELISQPVKKRKCGPRLPATHSMGGSGR